MTELLNSFNNREISLFIWLGVILLYIIFRTKDFWKLLGGLLKSFFQWKLFLPCLISWIYFTSIVYLMWLLNLWDLAVLKETIYWFVGGGIIIVIKGVSNNNEGQFIKATVIDNVKLAVFMEFLLNFYSFGLVAELIFMPMALILVALTAYSEVYKKETKSIKTTLFWLNSILGYVLISYLIYKVITDYQALFRFGTITTLIIAPILTVSSIPLIYCLALISKYEKTFIRLKFLCKDDILEYKLMKKLIYKYGRFSFSKLSAIEGGISYENTRDASSLKDFLINI